MVKSEYLFKKNISNYHVNITDNEVFTLFNSDNCKNIRTVLKDILEKYHDDLNKVESSEEYEKFKYIFKKTRINEFPTLELFKAVPIEMAKKFRLKVFNIFRDSHLFDDPDSLINMIGIFGLFENDNMVDKRIHAAINLFFHQKVFSKRAEMAIKPYIEKIENTSYILNENIKNLIPEELKVYLFPEITKKYYSFLRHMIGNYGRKINDFLVPYKKEGDILYLKDGIFEYAKLLFPTDLEMIIQIDISKYTKFLNQQNWYNLCNPYERITKQYYSLKKGLSIEECKKALSEFREYELTYGPSDIKSLFKNAKPIYNQEFYDFIIRHQADISISTNNFSKFSDVQKHYHELKKYYESRGNSDPDFITMIEWLREVPYDVEFGDEEFAIDAKNAGVLNEGYIYYTNLLKKVRSRCKRAIPNHNKFYVFVDKNGKEYNIQTQILNGTDPLNLLIGESKYTDCCQKYNDLGQACLEHASTSQLGGIFVVNLIEDSCKKILCQSWFWVNEQEAVLDNIEQTNILNSASDKQREIYEDLIAYAIKKAANDILIESNNQLLQYVTRELSKLENIANESSRESRRKRIMEILKRQSLKIVTVGANYSDIIVADYFKHKTTRKLYLPKDYEKDGYTDAETRYIVAGSESDITVEPVEDFAEESLYRDKRQIEIRLISDINNKVLKRIMDINDSIHETNIRFKGVNEFIHYYKLKTENTSIIYGEDWYCLIDHYDNQILKVCVGQVRLEDEFDIQRKEIENILSKINVKDEKQLVYKKKLR